MKKEFIPYAKALELAKLNFNEKCFGYYGTENELHIEISCNLDSNLVRRNFIASPTFSQAFRFFREKYDLCAYVVTVPNYIKGESKYKTRFSYEIYGMNEKSSSTVFITIRDEVNLSTHEEAELECLKKLIEIRQSQKTSDESPHTRTFRTPSSDYNSRGQYRK